MNILVVRTDKLGDFITALPTMYLLKEHNPNHKMIACVAPLNEELARACDFIDEVIVDRGEPLFTFVSQLRNANIEASVTLFSNTRVALAQFLAQIPQRIAPATKLAQIFYNRRVKQRRSEVKMAEYEYNLELARTLFPDMGRRFPSPLLTFNSKEQREAYAAFCKANNIAKPVIAFHPGFGGSSDANISVKEYLELAKIVIKHGEYQVVMTFGPGDEAILDEIKALIRDLDIVLYESKKGLVHFATLVSQFKLFVSTSTGTYHLAALVGTPTMTFFADTLFASVKRWKAVSDEAKQHPFMLPQNRSLYDNKLEEIKTALYELL